MLLQNPYTINEKQCLAPSPHFYRQPALYVLPPPPPPTPPPTHPPIPFLQGNLDLILLWHDIRPTNLTFMFSLDRKMRWSTTSCTISRAKVCTYLARRRSTLWRNSWNISNQNPLSVQMGVSIVKFFSSAWFCLASNSFSLTLFLYL